MAQNYRVFIGKVCIHNKTIDKTDIRITDPTHFERNLHTWIIAEQPEDVFVPGWSSPVDLFKMHVSQYRMHQAAGGLVFNNQQEMLMIVRNGKYDLPKGHLDEGESHQQAALREVVEETGLQPLEITAEGPETWHVYFQHEMWHLKCTRWFFMRAAKGDLLIPQVNEGITQVLWVKPDKIELLLSQSYRSLHDILLPSIIQHCGMKNQSS